MIDGRGHDYVQAAQCPAPLFGKIIGAYVVPVTDGPASYTTKHSEVRYL